MITGYIGPNGSGKTLSAVTDAQRWANKLNRPVYSTIPFEWEQRLGYANYVTRRSRDIESLDQLLDLDKCELLLDEVVSVLSSRETTVLAPKMVLAINMFRHRDLGVYWTAPDWNRADVILRSVTQDIHVFRPVIRKAVPGQRWFRTVIAMRKTFDGTDNAGSRLPKTARGVPRLLRLRGLAGFGTYQQRNPDMERVQGAGKYCATCGGLRKIEIEKCEC